MTASHRENLIEGAIACIQEQGISATTTRDIAKRAGAPLASIPYHFGTKDALLDEALAVALTRWREENIAMAGAGDPSLGPFGARLDGMLKSLPRIRPLAIAMREAQLRAMHNEEFGRTLAAYRRTAMMVGSVQLGALAEQAGIEVDKELATVAGLAFFDGVLTQWLLDPEHTPSARALIQGFTDLQRLFATAESGTSPGQ